MIFVFIVLVIVLVFSFGIGIYITVMDRKETKINVDNSDVKKIIQSNNLSKNSVSGINQEDTVFSSDEDEETTKFVARKSNNEEIDEDKD